MGTGEYHGYEIDSGGGYACLYCGQWVSSNMVHICTNRPIRYGYSCPKCGESIHGDALDEHICRMEIDTKFVAQVETGSTGFDAIIFWLREIHALLERIEKQSAYTK